jgi:hypothetical protein
MKTILFKLSWICILFLLFSFTEKIAFNKYRDVIIEHAAKLSTAYDKKDFGTIASLTHPKVLELLGGPMAMEKKMEYDTQDMESKGVHLSKVTIGEPSDIYETDSEIQCTLPQTILMELPNGKMEIKSTLIAASSDFGKTWYFIDTNGDELQEVRKMLPNISPDIKLPKKQQPVFIPKN